MSDRTEKQYQVKELADISGVSVRTLHYYEEIGLLAPGRTGSGYRIYDDDDIRRLQEILAMRACAMPLAEIKELLAASEGDAKSALMGHLQRLQAQKRNLEGAIAKTHGALSLIEGMEAMNDAQKFEELKRASIETFETTYGQEARELYGDEAIDASNAKFAQMSEDAWNAKELLVKAIVAQLKVAMGTCDPKSTAARELTEMHAAWIQMHWPDDSYTAEAHKSLAEGYLADERFIAYYDSAAGDGATKFLVEAVLVNL